MRQQRHYPQSGRGGHHGQFGRDREESDERRELQDSPGRRSREEWGSDPYETRDRQQGGMRQGFGYSDQDRGNDFRSPGNMWGEGGYRGHGNHPMGDYGQMADRGPERGGFEERGDWTQGGGNYFGYGSERSDERQGSYGMSDRSAGYGDWGRGSTSRGSGAQRGEMPIGRGGYGYGEQTGYGAGRGDWSRWTEGGQDLSQRRGPKGYTRSDERIKEDVCERLMHEPGVDVGEVSIEVQDGKVTLEGAVSDRRMKHRIEDVACGCMGVKDVDNRVRVERERGGDRERSGGRERAGEPGRDDGGSMAGAYGSRLSN